MTRIPYSMTEPNTQLGLFPTVVFKIIPLVLLIFMGMSYLIATRTNESMLREVEKHHTEETRHIEAQIRQRCDLLTTSVQLLAGNDLIQATMSDPDGYTHAAELFFRSFNLPMARNADITLVNPAGQGIISNRENLTSYTAHPFLDILAAGETFFQLDAAGIFCAAPIIREGVFLGAVAVSIRALHDSHIFLLESDLDSFGIMDAQKKIIFTSGPPLTNYENILLPDSLPAWSINTVPLPGYGGLQIATALETKSTRQPVENLQRYLMVGILVALFSLAFSILLMARMVTRPISCLAKGIKQITRTRKLSSRIPESGPRELQEIAGQFNRLVATLQATMVSRTHLNRMFNAMAEGVIVTSENLTIRSVNPALINLLGYDKTSLIATGMEKVIASSSRNHLKHLFISTREFTGQELRVTHENGRELTALVSCSSMPEGTDEQKEFVFVLRDITSRKKMEQDLTQATSQLHEANITLENRVAQRTRELDHVHAQMVLQEKMASLGQLSASISHELNNPINFVRTNIATLEDMFKDIIHILAAYREFTDRVHKDPAWTQDALAMQTEEEDVQLAFLLQDIPELFLESGQGFDRIAAIIQSMKEFSHVSHKGIPSLFDLNKGIETTLTIIQNSYKDIARVETNLENIPEIQCYADQLNQVLLNLIVNSAQAIESQHRDTQGLITIHTWADAGNVYCSITDDGPGVPEDIRSRLFEPFFTTKEPGRGTGLGLSISYEILVQRHKGSLDITCPPHGGTVFTLRIPTNLNALLGIHETD